MANVDVFRPRDGHDLLVRSPMNEGAAQRPSTSQRPATQGGYRFGQLSHNSFFTRHNPHPQKVRHIKGLLDLPICAVNDDGYFASPRYSLPFPPYNHDQTTLNSNRRYPIPVNAINVNSQLHPINTLTGLQNFTGLQSYPFREKAIPRIGLVPITETWRDELRQLTEAAGFLPSEQRQQPPKQPEEPMERPRTSQYSKDTGRLLPPPSRAMSRQASRQGKRQQFVSNLEHIMGAPDMETIVLQMLCQILQTDDINAVQAWLVSAGDREKTYVMDLVKSVVNSQQDYYENAGNYEYMKPTAEQYRPATAAPQYADAAIQTNGTIAGSAKPNKCEDALDNVDKMGMDNIPTGLMKSPDKWTRYSWTPERDAKAKQNAEEMKPPKSPVFRVKHSPRIPISPRDSKPKSQPLPPVGGASDPPRLRYTCTPKLGENEDKLKSIMANNNNSWQPERSVSQTLKVHD